jgi:hypothetical protein
MTMTKRANSPINTNALPIGSPISGTSSSVPRNAIGPRLPLGDKERGLRCIGPDALRYPRPSHHSDFGQGWKRFQGWMGLEMFPGLERGQEWGRTGYTASGG